MEVEIKNRGVREFFLNISLNDFIEFILFFWERTVYPTENRYITFISI